MLYESRDFCFQSYINFYYIYMLGALLLYVRQGLPKVASGCIKQLRAALNFIVIMKIIKLKCEKINSIWPAYL